MNRVVFVAAALVFWGCSDNPAKPVEQNVASSVQSSHAPMAIVLLTSGNPDEVIREYNITPKFVYRHALIGFAASISSVARAGLMNDARISLIKNATTYHLATIQTNPRQGLDRIDQRTTSLDNQYIYDRTGADVNAWIIDTGIRSTHNEFIGRVGTVIDLTGGSGSDCHGHGTHVAGILGGTIYGVAKSVTLNVFKVFPACDDTASEATVIAAIDSITAIATLPAVVNMSLEGPVNSVMNTAIANSIAVGLVYTVAAGNDNANACNYSPASATNALTIANALISPGSMQDRRSSDSNYGSCVDFFAPGEGVLSSWNTTDSATAYLSGTSMSAPHAAGVAAMYLQGRPTATPAEVADSLKAYTTRSVVTASNSTNCNLLYSNRTIQGGHIPRCPK